MRIWFTAGELLAVGLAILPLFSVKLPALITRVMITIGVISFVGLVAYDYGTSSIDLHVFHAAGISVWNRENPYRITGPEMVILAAPTIFPVVAAFASVPFPVCEFLWVGFNCAVAWTLVFVAQRTLVAQGEQSEVPQTLLFSLAVIFALSFAARENVRLGQFAAMEAIALYAAIYAQGRERPFVAGLFLAIATIKITTMLPFLVLFFRRKDLAAWLGLGVGILGLLILGGQPLNLPSLCQEELASIAKLGGPGAVNDFARRDSYQLGLITFDRLFFCLGLTDRAAVKIANFAANGLLALGAGAVVLFDSRISRPAACAFLALCSTLFLFHHLHDTMILALPIVYCAGRGMQVAGHAKWLYRFCSILMIGVLYLRVNTLSKIPLNEPGGSRKDWL